MALIIIHFIDFCKLEMMICILFPFAYFCSPLLIRTLLYFQEQEERRRKGATEEAIGSLPSKEFVAGLFPSGDDICAICFSKYEEGEKLRILPCHPLHHFHLACIDPWLALNASCPSCRTRVFPALDEHGSNPPDSVPPDIERKYMDP